MMSNAKKNIIEFNTSKVRGVFVKVPDGIFNNAIITDVDLGQKWLQYPDATGCTKIPLPDNLPWQIIGKSHSISKEGVEKMGISFEKYMKLLYDKNITYDYDKYTGQWLVIIADLTPAKKLS